MKSEPICVFVRIVQGEDLWQSKGYAADHNSFFLCSLFFKSNLKKFENLLNSFFQTHQAQISVRQKLPQAFCTNEETVQFGR